MGNTPGTSSDDNPQPKPDASSPTDSKSGSGNAPDAAPGDTPGGLEEGLTIFNPTEDSKPALPATVNSDRPPTSGTAGAGQGVQSIDAGGSNPFIGSGPPAKSTIYVVDASDSMSGPHRQGRVNAALIRAIEQLKPDQRFKVYFFATQYYTDNIGSGLIGATSKNKQKVIAWINQIGTHGGTNPLPAMLEALKLNPERIVLMSDGEFDPTSVPIITQANKKTKIDCAGMVEVVETLKQIASENKGIYYQVN